jgi:curli production assembly/transport component CsgE
VSKPLTGSNAHRRSQTLASTDARIWLYGVLMLAMISDPLAQDHDTSSDDASENSMLRQEGVTGLIVDNTITFMGRQFYDDFANAWLDQGIANGANLSVHEQPTAVSGTRIWVEYNHQILFQAFVSPVRSDIDATAKKAANLVAQRFKALELERKFLNDPDLGSDEL